MNIEWTEKKVAKKKSIEENPSTYTRERNKQKSKERKILET